MTTPELPIPVVVHDSRIVEQSPGVLHQSGSCGWTREDRGSVRLHADPAGVEPLAWRTIDRSLHLARYPATLARLEPRASLDLETLRVIARVEYPIGLASCFTGVRRLPPGTDVRIDPGGSEGESHKWWRFPPEPAKSSPVDLWRALVDQCAALMERSGDCAIFLSGGLDSAAVAAAAATAARERDLAPPLLLSVVYPGLKCDESPSQQLVADHLMLQLVQLDATRLEIWPAARDAIRQQGIPTADSQAAATSRLLAVAREQGRRLVLVGLGGDALFAGDGAELELYRRGKLRTAYRFFRDWGVAGGLPARVVWYRRGFRRYLVTRPFGTRAEIRSAGTANRSGLRRALEHPAHGWRTELIERTVGEPALTVGCPLYGKVFLDSFAQVRTLDLTVGPGYKGLLRSIVRPYLPSAVVNRERKANFHDFFRSWSPQQREALADEYLSLRPGVPGTLGLPATIRPLLTAPDFPAGLLSAWFSLCLAEFYSAWQV